MVSGSRSKCQMYAKYVFSKCCTPYVFRSPKCWLQQYWLGIQPLRQASCCTLSESFVPSDIEHELHEFWHKLICQSNSVTNTKTVENFSMILPPPNVTGTLHLGHSLTVTIQDVLARWHRMQGKRVLWIPGFDHAGIATQTTFERKLWRERRQTRYDIGRDQLEKELWNWKKEKQKIISSQLRNIGASLDWSHQYFTLDKKHSETVTKAFIQLHSDGLIYRTKSIVNWCCELQTAISDIEVNHMNVDGPTMLDLPDYAGPVEFGVLMNFAYKSSDGSELVVSTTRLETMMGDTAVAVHPSDSRYVQWHGAQLWHPFLQKAIPVICDESVDPHFGTGVVKVTPAHSHTDHDIGKRHNLEVLSVIDERGIMNEKCGKFKGLKRFEAREQIKDELAKLGLFRGQKHHAMSIPVCSRSGDVVEFILKPQWFLSCQEMSRAAVAAVERGELCLIPSSYNNVWFTWLGNLRDWCISRQLWWGHRIPAYQCFIDDPANTVWVAAENIEQARNAAVQKLNLSGKEKERIVIKQDVDVLDTWFSSALLPLLTVGWPHQIEDLKNFYPLSVMETGHDILFFWVARMVMLGTYLTGKLPFKKVVLHGIVCDSYGRKMSKSLGNVIDPQDVINGSSAERLLQNAHMNYDFGLISTEELSRTLKSNKIMFPKGIPECGTDALRFTFCSHNVLNVQIHFDVNLCLKNRHFCSKMWQACRYIQKKYDDVFTEDNALESAPPRKFDKWIISRLAYLVLLVDESLKSEAFHIASNALKKFVHEEFCTIYLEGTKPIVRACDSSSVRTVETLMLCMDVSLRLLNPFMPFITEHLYQHLPLRRNAPFAETISSAPYPSPQEWKSSRDEAIEDEIKDVLTVVAGLRHLQSTYKITKKNDPHGYIECSSDAAINRFKEHESLICTLSGVEKVEVTDHVQEDLRNDAVNIVFDGSNYIFLKTLKGKDEEKEFLEKTKRYKLVLKDLEKLQKMTKHPGYNASAPEKVQSQHKQKMARLEAEMRELKKYQEVF